MADNRFGSAVLMGILWSMVGAVYAGLFTVLWQVFEFKGMESMEFLAAAALAGIAGAAIYGAMQVAIVATLTGIVSATAYMVIVGKQMDLWDVVLVAAVAGALLGAVLKLPGHFTRGEPSKAIAGLVAGAAAGAIVMLLIEVVHSLSDITIVTGLLVMMTGVIYVTSVTWWVRILENRVPGTILDALVSAVVAGIVGGSVWILGGPVLGVVSGEHGELLRAIGALLPSAMAGGAFAGAVSGALLELVGIRLTAQSR